MDEINSSRARLAPFRLRYRGYPSVLPARIAALSAEVVCGALENMSCTPNELLHAFNFQIQ